MRNNKISFFAFFILTCGIVYGQLKVKDQEPIPNTLMQVTDEGISGSVLLPPLPSSPSDVDQKLYNISGELFWNGNMLGTSFSAAGWTYDGTNILTSTVNNKVGIGMAFSPTVKLSLGIDIAPKKLALFDGPSDFYGLGVDWGRITFYTNNTEKMTITDNGFVGIGKPVPSANLEVQGNVKIGENGVKFFEIYELEGETGTGGTDRKAIAYPTGYNKVNTRVLTYEVRETIADSWVSGDDGLWYALGDYDITVGYGALYTGSYFRLILMKVEQLLL